MGRADSKRRTVTNLAIASLVVVGGAWLFMPGTDEPLPPTPSALPEGAPSAPEPATPLPPRGVVETPPVAAPRAPLDARLVATVVGVEATRSFAAISRLDGTDTQLVGVGEALAVDATARVAAIGEGFVDIDHAGTRVRLTSTSSLDPLSEEYLAALRQAPRREVSPQERERRRAMAERLRARIAAGPGSGTRIRGSGLVTQGRAMPLYEGDRLTAIEIDEVEAGGLYDRIGLESGDRIRAINGIPVGDPDAAGRILQELATAQEIVADVDRGDGGGGDEVVSIPTDELLDLMREQLAGMSEEELRELPMDQLPIEGLPLEAPPAE